MCKIEIEEMAPICGKFKMLEHRLLVESDDECDCRNTYGDVEEPDGECIRLSDDTFEIVLFKDFDDDDLERITRALHVPPALSAKMTITRRF